jgi:hypothetical protein
MSPIQASRHPRATQADPVPCLSPAPNKPQRAVERPATREPVQLMYDLRQSLDAITLQVNTAAARCSGLLREPFIGQEPNALRDTEHLRERIAAMARLLDDTLQTMDRLLERSLVLRAGPARPARPLTVTSGSTPGHSLTE